MVKDKNKKSRIPYIKRRVVEWIIVIMMVIGFMITLLVEFNFINIPLIFLQRTGNNEIYQTLFSAQASMVGIVLAILALITNIIDSKIYGFSVTLYIMKIRPLMFFRYGWVIIETIILLVLSWCSIALNFNNIAVALFIITTVLLIRITIDILGLIHSTQNSNKEVGDYIISKAENIYLENLFNEINESLISGNAILFHYDIDFAENYIKIHLDKISYENNDVLQNLFTTLIHTAYELNSSKIAYIIDLYILTIEKANELNISFVEYDYFLLYEIHQLFSKVSPNHLYGVNSKKLLERWQEAMIINVSLNHTTNNNTIRISSDLYYFIYINNHEQSNKTAIKILHNIQTIRESFSSKNDITKEIADEDYLELIMTLFKKRDEHLLNVLFGFDGSSVDVSFRPIISRDNNFDFTKVNVFIVLYLYYLSYKEYNVESAEKEYCEKAFTKIAPLFWESIEQYVINNQIEIIKIKETYEDFNKMLSRHERYSDYSYGFSFGKFIISDDVVLDFFMYTLINLSFSEEKLENIFNLLLNGNNIYHGKSMYEAFERYVKNDLLNDYKQYCDIMRIYKLTQHEDGYNKLKNIITKLYINQQVERAQVNGEEFSVIQNDYEKNLNKDVHTVINEYKSQFSSFTENDNPRYRVKDILIPVPIINKSLPLTSKTIT